MARTEHKKRPLQRTFIREWRKHRGLSLESLAERLQISHSTLGRIERAELPYNQRFIEDTAAALRCEISDLLTRDPASPEGIWSLWASLSAAEREKAVAVLQVFKEPANTAKAATKPAVGAVPFTETTSSRSRRHR